MTGAMASSLTPGAGSPGAGPPLVLAGGRLADGRAVDVTIGTDGRIERPEIDAADRRRP
jgi:hypothetical protein